MRRLVGLKVAVDGRNLRRIEHITIARCRLWGGDLREAPEVGAGRLVEADRRLPFREAGDRAAEVHQRVRLERHRCVAGHAAGGQFDRPRDLLRRLHRGEPDLSAFARHATAFGEAILGLDIGEVLLDHEVDADARRSLFPRFREEDHVAIKRDVEPLEQQHDHQRRRQVVLVVDRAAPVDVAAVAGGAERPMRPLRRIDVDDIGVAHEEQRALRAVPLEASHEVRTLVLQRE